MLCYSKKCNRCYAIYQLTANWLTTVSANLMFAQFIPDHNNRGKTITISYQMPMLKANS